MFEEFVLVFGYNLIMERENSIYRTATKANSRKIFLALGIAGLPIALSFAAYFWLFSSGESNNNKNKKDGGQHKKSGPPSKRVMKGIKFMKLE